MNKDVDWIIHSVFPTEDEPEYIQNNHTHGIMEKHNHPDFQLVLHAEQSEVGRLLNIIGLRVANGERFNTGDMVSGLYEDCDIRLDEFNETGRTVLRLIVPDGQNRFPEDPNCKVPYKHQLLKFQE